MDLVKDFNQTHTYRKGVAIGLKEPLATKDLKQYAPEFIEDFKNLGYEDDYDALLEIED